MENKKIEKYKEKLIEKYFAPILDNSELGFYDPRLEKVINKCEKIINKFSKFYKLDEDKDWQLRGFLCYFKNIRKLAL